jgi:hypothetical protein
MGTGATGNPGATGTGASGTNFTDTDTADPSALLVAVTNAGGAGGGGWFGGGGGGVDDLATTRAGTSGGSAGGAGGGSGFGPAGTAFETGVRAGDGQVLITPADPGVGCDPLAVRKVVVGTGTSGYTEHVACEPVVLDTVSTTATETFDLPFLADGTPDASASIDGWVVSDGTWLHPDAFDGLTACTVTETVTGGASSVTYECAWTIGQTDGLPGAGCPGAASGPSATPATVVTEGNGDHGVITVTNTIPAVTPTPPPAPLPLAVVATPRFTG